MSTIFSALNISDSDRVYNSTAGQQAIFEAVTDYVNRINADLNAALSVFVEGTTSDFKRRYKLPGGGYLQRRGSNGSYGSVKASGAWDVAFPLEDFGAAISSNDVDRAYMTVAELDRHVQTITAQNVNTVRFEVLKALLNASQDTFVDPLHGSLSIEPLANGDAVVYPPVLGADTEATDTHYLEAGYIATAISDTNNPYPVIANELEEHFGAPTGGSSIAVFVHPDEVPETRALASFIAVGDNAVRYGSAQDLVSAVPDQLSRTGRVIGRIEGAGVWVVEWRYLPTGYMLGVHLDAPAPLVRRIDPADTGLGDGLQLVAEDQEFPFQKSNWRHRFGFGAGNRLNGVVMELANGGSYTTPTAYA